MGPDAVTLEVYRHLFTALAEEMGASLRRASFSPNIKERRDYSCALFDPEGVAVALGDHMPVHLGAMPMSVEAALAESGVLEPGDVVILNDPFKGGTHLPDITLISAVYSRGDPALLGFVASRAHHSDVGGMSPGSMPLAQEIYQEGLRIPPVRLYKKGVRNEELWETLLANVRTPVERAGDLDAQLAALHTGNNRLLEMVDRRGKTEVLAAMQALIAYADRLVGAGIQKIPDGVYEAEDSMDDDGFGSGPVPIRLLMEVSGDQIRLDFAGTSPQTRGGINAVAAITSSATRYVVRCMVEALLGTPLPAGGGSMSAVQLQLPPGSLVNASPPASVAAGNVETSQRITDVLLQVFGKALPDLGPALSQGTMNNTTVGGIDHRSGETFAYYETVGGGLGAAPQGPGLSGVHSHMSNSLNTPVEALEHAYPFRVVHYGIRRNSGGTGLHKGGDGLRRDIQLLTPGRVTLLTERRLQGPRGAAGGKPGAVGENVLIRQGAEESIPGKVTFDAMEDDIISVRSPGGGGWGEPSTGDNDG
ncbi:MAG: hydantoinase B/oxoprolinase family protein [Gemmatimonadetes bacterium]|nr:hydantoinase B/oxoprolinase family protein [Gemmatimonadota bacterium]